MSDTITPEERASWRERLENPFSCHDSKRGAFTLRLLAALEAAEARAAKNADDLRKASAMAINAETRLERAEAENARLRAERDWLARELWDFYPQKNIAELTEAARRAVAEKGE